MWLPQCPKPPVWEHPSRVNVFTSPKYCRNLHGSTFILISHEPQTNWVEKHLCQSDLKSQDCLVTRSVLITYIVVIIERISCNMFKRHYIKNRNHFRKFFLHFCNLHKILCILKEKSTVIAQIFWRLLTQRKVFTWIPESSCFRTPFYSQCVHVSQTLLKTAPQHFYPNFPLGTKK